MNFHSIRVNRAFGFALSMVLSHAFLGGMPAGAQTYTLTTLANLNDANGYSPIYVSPVLDGSGNLYGTTRNGGANSLGIVFKIALGTDTLTTIVTFNGSNGELPYAGVTLDGKGDIFGTTEGNNFDGTGTVFEIAAGTSTLKTISTFSPASGDNPMSALTLDAKGNLYGTTYESGPNNDGGVFEIAAGTSTITPLAIFNGANGETPIGGVIIDSSGNLYGTTYGHGGTSNYGTVFKIAAGTGLLTTLVTFNSTNGAAPYDCLTLDSSGNLYGTTSAGGLNGVGTVFKIASGTNTLTTLASFSQTAGYIPFAGLTFDAQGNLFGTTSQGGVHGDGTVFEIAAATNTISTLYNFDGTDGQMPSAAVTLDGQGNLYGTTELGGTSGHGTVFELSPQVTNAASAPEPSTLALLLSIGSYTIIRRSRLPKKSRPIRSQSLQEATLRFVAVSRFHLPTEADNLSLVAVSSL